MRIRPYLAALLVVLTLVPPAHANTLDFQALIDKARELNTSGQPQAAEVVAREALALADAKTNAYARIERLRAPALYMLGTALRLQGRYVEAETVLREGLPQSERGLGRTHRNAIATRLQLGMALLQQGRYADSDGQLREAVARAAEMRDPERLWYWTWSRAWLANLDILTGRYEEAEGLCREVIERGENDNSLARWHHFAELNMARMRLKQKRPVEAESHALKAARLIEAGWGVKHSMAADTYDTLARALLHQDKLAEAEPWLRQALDIARPRLGQDFGGAIKAFIGMGEYLEAQGDLAGAEAMYREALEKGGDRAIQETLVYLLRRYASLLSRSARESEAAPLFQRAMDIADRLFAQTANQESISRERLVEHIRPIYSQAVHNLVEWQRKSSDDASAREALAVVSRTQSRIFTEMLRQTDVAQHAGDPRLADLRQRFSSARQEESNLTSRLAQIAVTDPGRGSLAPASSGDDALVLRRKDEQIDALATDLKRARHERERIERELWQSYPSFMELTAPRPVTVETLQKNLLKPDETLLAYYLLPKAVVIFLVSRDDFKFVLSPQEEGAVAALVQAVREPVENGGQGKSALRQLDPDKLHRLYSILLNPVAARIAPDKKLLIVGDGPLFTLPFEMLVTRWGDDERKRFEAAAAKGDLSEYGTLDYAGARNRFSYLPSLAALAYQRGQERKERGHSLEFMAFADPVFEYAGEQPSAKTRGLLEQMGAIRGARAGIPRLPETADEVKAIAEILGGRNAVYLREAAQEERAKKADLRAVRYLHFATHGLLGYESSLLQSFRSGGNDKVDRDTLRNLSLIDDEGDPSMAAATNRPAGQPALLLTLVGDLGGEDGLLTMGEIVDGMKLDADLVVLSACNTAGERENSRGGEGFAGLTRAFMHAGAKGLLVSHWSVESQSTKDLMVDVFRRLKSGRNAPQALAEAQAAMRSSNPAVGQLARAHPFFWAPFVYVGD